ncbi:hypothetical protein YJ57_20270 [Salmonella enterica subsp. enterica]|nr:hypothetical protein [Salmonella enterica subsp. enterica]EDV1533698.1 hypothetical protein [Salmonella enterica subsp. enterica]
MARPVTFTREMMVGIAKRYYEWDITKSHAEFFKNEGIEKSTFHKLLKKYEIKVKITAEVC